MTHTLSVSEKIDNSLFILLYLFQYGLLIPMNIVVDSQYPIVIFSLLIVVSSFINKPSLSIQHICLIVSPILILLLKLPFELPNSKINVWMESFIGYIAIGLSGIYIGSLKFDIQKFLQYGYWVAFLNFVLIIIIPFTNLYGETVNYMRFGYALLPSVIFFYHSFLKRKNLFNLALASITFLVLLIYGARGAMFTFCLFLFFYHIVVLRPNKLKKLGYVSVVLILYFSLKYLITAILDYLRAKGEDSYALSKYLNLLNGESLASTSSGRDVIYETAIDRFSSSPIFGAPLNSCYVDTGSTYYHNIFIEIGVNFGIVGLLVFFVFMIKNFMRFTQRNQNDNLVLVFVILFTIPIGRLILSSSFWLRPEFWVFLSFCLNYKKHILNYKK